MAKRTLFVSDLDGTLLNKETKISDTTADILKRLIKEENLLFTIATARTPATAVPMTEAIDIQLPMIVMTGAAQWIRGEQRYVNATTLESDKVSRIIDICHNGGINPFVYGINENMLNVLHTDELNRQELSFVEERVNSPFKHFYLEKSIHAMDAVLMFACNETEKIRAVHKLVQENVDCEAICYHDIYNENQGFLEVFAPGTSKARAIRQLAKDVDADKVVVFGDNLNDISMLSIADVAVAMGNAYPEVKEVADTVIGDNDSDSVAKWILENYKFI